MKKELYSNVLGKFEKVKNSVPYLERAIKSKSAKKIEDLIAYFAYLLHRLHKRATGQGTAESIQTLSNKTWWFKMQKDKDVKKIKTVNKLYSDWAKEYDSTANLLTFLEEKVSNSFIGNVKNKEVLDFGCGTGRYAIPLAKKGAKITCIDFTDAMLKETRRKSKKAGVKFEIKKQDITKYKPDKKFDIIISMLVLDHIKNLKKAIDAIDKASKIGTKVVISNVHPEILRQGAITEKHGRAQGYLLEGIKTDQYRHPVSDYIELFKERGFYLTKTKNLIVEPKYIKMKRFKGIRGIVNKSLGIIMSFEKIK